MEKNKNIFYSKQNANKPLNSETQAIIPECFQFKVTFFVKIYYKYLLLRF